MRRLWGETFAAFAASMVLAGAATAAVTSPGVGSSVTGNGGDTVLTFGFDNVATNHITLGGHSYSGRFFYSLADTFYCTNGSTTAHTISTFKDEPAAFPENIFQPFPAVTSSYHSFHYVFATKYRNATGSKVQGTATVAISGRIKQTGGKAGGPGSVVADGTIGIRVSDSCRTGTVKWTAKGHIVSPGSSSAAAQ
jgi:hypothetical protein